MIRHAAAAVSLSVALLAEPLAGAPPAFSLRVHVAVGGDKDLQPLVTSYVSQELRKLSGVTVADERHDYEIKVIAQQDTTGAGVVLGFSLAWVVVRMAPDQAKLPASARGAGFVRTLKLVGGPIDNLQDTCRDLVTELDGTDFESDRKEFQRKVDAAKKRKG